MIELFYIFLGAGISIFFILAGISLYKYTNGKEVEMLAKAREINFSIQERM